MWQLTLASSYCYDQFPTIVFHLSSALLTRTKGHNMFTYSKKVYTLAKLEKTWAEFTYLKFSSYTTTSLLKPVTELKEEGFSLDLCFICNFEHQVAFSNGITTRHYLSSLIMLLQVKIRIYKRVIMELQHIVFYRTTNSNSSATKADNSFIRLKYLHKGITTSALLCVLWQLTRTTCNGNNFFK